MRCKLAAVALVAIAAVTFAWSDAVACGPDFAVELLSDRQATLLDIDDGIFLDEATQLVAAPEYPFTVIWDWDKTASEKARAAGGDQERSLYERGARAFHAGDAISAARSFEALLALPVEQRRQRSTWAAYMLGRVRGRQSAYALVRELTRAGFRDELGLAASSLGQEARLRLDRGDAVAAVRLYAEQAAHGHPDGATSLLLVVRALVKHGQETALAADPVGQKLLAVYLYTRPFELTRAQRERLWNALAAGAPFADRLAVVAYREGRWELAERLALRDPDSLLSKRILAKLSLRRGDTVTAERLLSQIVSAKKERCSAPGIVEADVVTRVHVERAAIALFEGRVMDAMNHAWAARRSNTDGVQLAERVLTIDELAFFVDRLALSSLFTWQAASPRPSEDDVGAVLPSHSTDYDEHGADWFDETELGELLARRLMRDGQHERALPYFSPEHRAPAALFVASLTRARTASDSITRANAFFSASQIARRSGLEILGTTHAPDWGMYGAQYDPTAWQEARAPGPWTTQEEQRRITSSAPQPDARYHYRYTASNLAEQAADHLPRRSQAFAAALCHSARYVFNEDTMRVRALWRRYVREGPTVDFSSSFGQSCPAPQFERARRYLPRRTWPYWLPIAQGLYTILLAWLAFRLGKRLFKPAR